MDPQKKGDAPDSKTLLSNNLHFAALPEIFAGHHFPMNL